MKGVLRQEIATQKKSRGLVCSKRGIAAGTVCPRNDGIDPNSSALLVIASVAKQSPTWNKYSNYCFLSAEIAAGINALAMTDWFPVGDCRGHCVPSQ